MEGPLCKWTNVMKGWQYRWFVLDDNAGVLSYYTTKEKMMRGTKRGCIRLKCAIMGIDGEDDFTFTITADHKTLYFQAADAMDRERWITALENTINLHSLTKAPSIARPTDGLITQFDRHLGEADAYLQLLIDHVEALSNQIKATTDEEIIRQGTYIKCSSLDVIETLKHAIVLLQLAKSVALSQDESLPSLELNGGDETYDMAPFNSRSNRNRQTKSGRSQTVPTVVDDAVDAALMFPPVHSVAVPTSTASLAVSRQNEAVVNGFEDARLPGDASTDLQHPRDVTVTNNLEESNLINFEDPPTLSTTVALVPVPSLITTSNTSSRQPPQVTAAPTPSSSAAAVAVVGGGGGGGGDGRDPLPITTYTSSEDEDDEFFEATEDDGMGLDQPTNNHVRHKSLSSPDIRGETLHPLTANESTPNFADKYKQSSAVLLSQGPENDDGSSSLGMNNSARLKKDQRERKPPPRIISAEDDYFDELYDAQDDEALGNVQNEVSMFSHLLSQVRIGMDLTKVTLPTFILERRSLLEMYADFFAHPDLFVGIPDEPTPRDRMIRVVRWYLSAFHAGRRSSIAKKPYNPVLGEIFGCTWDVPGYTKPTSKLSSGPPPPRPPPPHPASHTSSSSTSHPVSAAAAASSSSAGSNATNYSGSNASHWPANTACMPTDATTSSLALPSQNQSGVSSALAVPASAAPAPFTATASLTPSTALPARDPGAANEATSPLFTGASTMASTPSNLHLRSTGDKIGPVPWARNDQLSFYSEQVSHHPPISAFYAEFPSKNICVDGYIHTKSRFYGLSIGVLMDGQAKVTLLDHQEEYVLTFPNGYGRSIMTVPWMEMGGDAKVQCEKTGYSAEIKFHTKPFYGGRKHRVTAEVYPPGVKKSFCSISGEWNGVMIAKYDTGVEESFVDTTAMDIIKKSVKPREQQLDIESRKLWENVTKALKERNTTDATTYKSAIEQKQRDDAKARLLTKTQWQHYKFHQVGNHWSYNNPLTNRLHHLQQQQPSSRRILTPTSGSTAADTRVVSSATRPSPSTSIRHASKQSEK